MGADRADVGEVFRQVLRDVLHHDDRSFGNFFGRVKQGAKKAG
jgi:hypothetical protein